MKGKLRNLLVVALMSASVLVPAASVASAAAAPENNAVNVNSITKYLSNGEGNVGSISGQEADAIFNSAKSGAAKGGQGGGRLIPF